MKGKKLLTILLCVMLLGSSVPTGVLAAEDVPVETAAAEATAEASAAEAADENDVSADSKTTEEAVPESVDETEPKTAIETVQESVTETAAGSSDNLSPVKPEPKAPETGKEKEPVSEKTPEAVFEGSSEGKAEETVTGGTEDPEPEYPVFKQSRTLNGVTVTVRADTGIFPENAELSVSAVPASEIESAIGEVREESVNVARSYTFDIKILDADGKELQPADGQSVKVSFSLAEADNDNLETKIWHIYEDESQGILTAEELNVVSKGQTVTADTDGFSFYTVEFTYGDLQYVLPGGKSVPLSAILETVGLSGIPEAVSVSDESLFSASRESGEWVVTSHRAFSSTETMAVTMKGIRYDITVTDYRGTLYYYDENGNQIKLTEWFHIESRDDIDRLFTWNDRGFNQYAVHAGENVTYDRRIDVKNDVILILGDGATLTIKGGIHVSEGNSLTIYRQEQGTGKLIITDVDSYNAGIGGNNEEACGTVRICGGNIEVAGGKEAAGIGGGRQANGGRITITGGTVTAYSGDRGAGIGGGSGFSNDHSGHGGTITITGGTVHAVSTADNDKSGAGIGGGWHSDGGTITITGGTVIADGNNWGAGIGGGEYGGGGNVTITGGTVTASSGVFVGWSANAQAIGHGKDNSNEGSLTIGDASQGVYMRAGRVSGQTVAWADAADRMNVCRSDYRATIRVEPCTSHVDTVYANNLDGTHTVACRYCGSTLRTESHTYTDGVCVCGAEDLSGIDFGLINDIPPTDGGYVWMGGDSPVKWQVIGANDSNWLLISSDLIDSNGNTVNWYDTKNYCETLFSGFSGAEQAAVPVTAKSEPDDYRYESNYGYNFGHSSVNDKMFTLSSEEAETYFSSNASRLPGLWWLRSPFLTSDIDARGGVVFGSGAVGDSWVYNTSFGVRPAFQLNLESVLFSSAAEGGKSSAAAGSGEFGTIIKTSGDGNNEIKLTLTDSARSGFSASAETTAVSPGGTLDVNYSGVTSGDYVSALLCNTSGEILYYAGKTPEASGDGVWRMTIPEDLAEGSYKIKVFSEKVNGDKITDYASPASEIALTVTPQSYTVTVVGGTADKATAKVGDTVTITADAPEPGFAFSRWAHVDDVDYDNASAAQTTFPMPAKDVTLTADFREILLPDISDRTYTGQAIEPTFSLSDVKLKGVDEIFVNGTHYDLSYANNINAGTATLTLKMRGPRTGSKSITFKILPADISTATISDISDQEYTGSEIKPEPKVTWNGKTLVKDKDYTLAYAENTDAGTATVTVTGCGNFTGTKTVIFKITPKPLVITAEEKSKTYGEADPELTYTADGLVGSDAITGALTRAAGENAGFYDITRGTLSAGDNYTIDFTGANFTIGTKTLTVTARPQKYPYNGQIQGEGDTAYEDPAEIAEKVSVIGLCDGDSIESLVLDGQGTDAGSYELAVVNVRVVNDAGDEMSGNYAIDYKSGTLTIEPAKVTITVDSASKAEGDSDPTITGTVEGLVEDGDLGEVRFVRSGSEEATGTYMGVLTATYTKNPNYAVTVVPGDFTIKAVYTLQWLDSNGGVLQEKTYAEGDSVPAYDGEEPTKKSTAQYSYEFSGWDEGSIEGKTTTYKPLFKEVLNRYKVTFVDEDGKTVLKAAAEYDYGTPAEDIEKPADPTKEADAQYTYTFTGWDPEIAEVTGDATYKATYTAEPVPVKKGTLTFDLGGGTLDGKTGSITIEANVGDTIKLPGAPTREGYMFQYWKGSRYEAGADYKVEGDHTFTAVWEENKAKAYTVTFDANGHGTAPDSQTVEEGKKASKPKDPTVSGYTFGGWFTDKECKSVYSFDTPVTKDITLYAKWTKNSSSTVDTGRTTSKGTSGGTSASTTGTSSAKTGDESQTGLWLMLMMASLLGIAVIASRRKEIRK